VTDDLRGRLLGRYRLLDLLGRGGMGAVYRARDESLGRDVAVKVLPPELTADPARVERFVQEARAASALNHPHLTAVYEIGSEPLHYIAMELVPGRTLRAILDQGRPDVPRALEWMVQITDALAAAHDVGVIHRDIKPENVMITDDGYAKVLDFGVAKLRATDVAEDVATRVSLTGAGVLIGTSGYMSPEQARGVPTDPRTDIFALGCVLYECVSGRAAFDGPSVVERLHRVIHDQPAPLDAVPEAAPTPLIAAIRKCLAKDPAERYQSMRELGIDLRSIRREVHGQLPRAAPVSHATRRTASAVRAAIVVAAAASGALALYWQADRTPSITTGPASFTIERLTSSGNTINAAISADGKYLAHVEAIGGSQSLWVRTLETGEDRQIVPTGVGSFYGAEFTRDGQSIFFTARGPGYTSGALFSVPFTGGPFRQLLNTILTPIAFSPDGREMAFLREQFPDQDSSAVVIAKTDGTAERVLATRRLPESFTPTYFTKPSWSPDGASLAVTARNEEAQRSRLLLLDTKTGVERELHAFSANATSTEWLPDQSGILFVRRPFLANPLSGQIWLTAYPDGAARRITSDLLDYRSVSVTADGRTLVTVGAEFQAALYMVPLDGQPPRRVPSNRYDGGEGIAPLADGSLLVATILGNDSQIVRITPASGARTVLTKVGNNTQPAVSPDGRTIAFVSERDGGIGVWRMNIDGSDQRMLVRLPSPAWTSFTPDNQHVICTSTAGARVSTWSVPATGGQAREIATGFDRAVVSPDGRWLAGIYVAGRGDNARPIAAVLPLDGSAPPRSLGTLVPATTTGVLTWNKDGTGLIGTTNERFNVWFYPISGEGPRRLTNLSDDTFITGRLMPDGKSVVAARGVFPRNAVALRNFK
jgi:eukaryotic-like serine/threonine-protein kinase